MIAGDLLCSRQGLGLGLFVTSKMLKFMNSALRVSMTSSHDVTFSFDFQVPLDCIQPNLGTKVDSHVSQGERTRTDKSFSVASSAENPDRKLETSSPAVTTVPTVNTASINNSTSGSRNSPIGTI